MDIPVNLVVELGKTKISLSNLSTISVGSVIELTSPQGEPLNILANGKLIARGQVVVINDNFGVRITEILQ